MYNLTTVEIGQYKIALPLGLPRGLETPVRDGYQDFLQEGTTDVRRHLTALTELLPPHLYKNDRVLHCFGGVGATAQVIDQTVEGVEHVFWERDPVLVEYLRWAYPEYDVIQVKDSYDMFKEVQQHRYEVILFDPSVGSIKHPKMKAIWEHMVVADPDVIWLSDTACSKIHLNAKYYATDFGREVEPTAEGYLLAYDAWLRETHGIRFTSAMREAQEMYAVLNIGLVDQVVPTPIPYL